MQWYLCRILSKSVQKVILNIYYVWQSACTERNEDETFGTKLRKFVLHGALRRFMKYGLSHF